MDRTQSIQEQFSKSAAKYAHSAVHTGGPDLDALLSAAELTGSERVLDLGCGPGHTALALAPGAAEVVGVDMTPAMLEQARALATARGVPHARFEQADVANLPFDGASFEVVSSRFSAHHYAEPARVIAEVARVLVPGGRFLLVDTVAPEDPAGDTFLNAIELLRDASHVRDHSVKQWQRALEAAGFAVAPLGSWQLALDFDAWVERIDTPPGAVAQLTVLLGGAPEEIQRAFSIGNEGPFDWKIPVALLRAVRS